MDNSARRDRIIRLYEWEEYNANAPPENLMEFVEWAAGMLQKIPAEHRGTAEIEFGSVGSYEDSHYATVEIFYRRPETDEEMASRIEMQERKQTTEQEQGRREYERLRAIYGTRD